MKPKEALIRDGFPGIKEGKGRLSLAAIERCKELAAAGWNIDGYSVSKATAEAPATVVKEKVANGAKVISDIPDQRRDENAWRALAFNRKGSLVDVGIKKVCNGCGNSLTHCYEETSRVWVDFDHEAVVEFKPVKEKR